MHLLKSVSKLTILLIITLQLCCISEATAGIKGTIGGSGGSSTSSPDEGNSSSLTTVLYVTIGVAVALVAWKYISEKNEKEAGESDSTEAVILKPLQDYNNRLETRIQKIEEQIPVNIELGLSKTFYNDKRYLVGVKVKL